MAQHSYTIAGNIVADPKFRRIEANTFFTMRVAASRAVKRDEDKWDYYDQLYLTVECWGDLAVNCAASLGKGLPIIATGKLVTHEWLDGNGKQQSRVVLRAQHVGVDLKSHTVGIKKVSEVDVTPAEDVTPADGPVDNVGEEEGNDLVSAATGDSGEGEPPF
ncbi:single-stranded DNA-binding protein [Corynebacterium hindlerae]|uniref:Single-stranded DNA-binding protein n=1 Tax=Corynebacterium hindlerae TaxID=699041 RepID=A0A7G5FDR2_9CORY|nr:single-stranded DNA-binding protein [Corynebacterium hindlerae]QMV84753.1 single-stranded DNA-binding protein [Corynebacterium hindlerae]